MVKDGTQLDLSFGAMSDPVRRAIVHKLSAGPTRVGALAEPFDISLPAVSKHLRVLERAGLMRQERVGTARVCHLVATPLRDASNWLERYRGYWEAQLDGLADYFEQNKRRSK